MDHKIAKELKVIVKASWMCPKDDYVSDRILSNPEELSYIQYNDLEEIINEPYGTAGKFGPEGKHLKGDDFVQTNVAEKEATTEEFNIPLAFDETICTFDWAKKTLEADYPGKKLVFCKDMASAVEGRYQALPEGFRHTFLIRNPLKVFRSYRNMIMNLFTLTEEQQKAFRLTDLPPDLISGSAKYKFGEMVDLLHHLQEHGMESNPVVIDADDLQSQPESIVRQYCISTGIPFSNDLLQWEAGDKITFNWITSKKVMSSEKRGRFYARALASSKFELSKNAVPDKREFTPDVVHFAEAADKYYKELFNMRLKP